MSSPDLPPNEELLALCDKLLDGDLSSEERARIETLVLGQPQLRRLYVEYLQLHGALRQQSSRLGEVPLEQAIKSTPVRPARPFRPSTWVWKAAAAFVLGTCVSGGAWLAKDRTDVVATLDEVQGARWENSTLATEPGSKLKTGRLRLSEGLARLTFRCGAELTLEGPAELDLISSTTCHLLKGAVVAHVPEPARGFTVLTDRARLIDHGTDFGISADASGNATVHVMKGEVELRHNQGGQPVHLTTRQMASITPDKLLPASVEDAEPGNPSERAMQSPFNRELNTAAGSGAATYVTSPGTDKHYSDALLLLKNGPTKNFLRKAILRFDLSTVPRDAVEAARLTLNFDLSGFGFATLGGDATFAIYGLTDEAQDSWDPATLQWNTMPAYASDAGHVDDAKAVKLGTFVMRRGVLRGAFSIDGQPLSNFLNRDANRQATIIIVRENPLIESAGVVHGIAGNHHPSLPPPTLRLRVKDGAR